MQNNNNQLEKDVKLGLRVGGTAALSASFSALGGRIYCASSSNNPEVCLARVDQNSATALIVIGAVGGIFAMVAACMMSRSNSNNIAPNTATAVSGNIVLAQNDNNNRDMGPNLV